MTPPGVSSAREPRDSRRRIIEVVEYLVQDDHLELLVERERAGIARPELRADRRGGRSPQDRLPRAIDTEIRPRPGPEQVGSQDALAAAHIQDRGAGAEPGRVAGEHMIARRLRGGRAACPTLRICICAPSRQRRCRPKCAGARGPATGRAPAESAAGRAARPSSIRANPTATPAAGKRRFILRMPSGTKRAYDSLRIQHPERLLAGGRRERRVDLRQILRREDDPGGIGVLSHVVRGGGLGDRDQSPAPQSPGDRDLGRRLAVTPGDFLQGGARAAEFRPGRPANTPSAASAGPAPRGSGRTRSPGSQGCRAPDRWRTHPPAGNAATSSMSPTSKFETPQRAILPARRSPSKPATVSASGVPPLQCRR